jgi:DNA-binding NtrC family response regulator
MRIRKPRVLLVERETDASRALSAALRGRPIQLLWAHDEEAALNVLGEERVDAVIAPLRAPRIDGLALLRRARARHPAACVVLVAEGGDLERTLAALRAGASYVEPAPVPPEKLAVLLERGLAAQAVAAQLAETRARLEERWGLAHLVANSPPMRRALEQVVQVAPLRVPVVVEGAPGSGKRTIAQAIHQGGPRRDEPFVWVACDAIAPDEVEAELFGVAEGARPGGARVGRFARADGGTLYLGGAAALPPAAQAALLRALHDGGFEPIGARSTQRADVRLIVGTERDLGAEVAAGRFRADLRERLSVVHIRVPSLDERREDLPLLVERLLAEIGRERGRRPPVVTRGALERLAAHAWPDNARGLRHTLEAMTASAHGRHALSLSDLPDDLRGPEDAERVEATVGMTVSEAERRLIAATLHHSGGDKRRAAALLGIGLRTLYRKLREYDLEETPGREPRARRRRSRR